MTNCKTVECGKSRIPKNKRVYAIGDIHGRADLLFKLLDRIDEDATGFVGEVHLVFLGDYIDRGLQSRQVIETLLSERGAKTVRYRKPTFTKNAPLDLREKIRTECDAVLEALAD